MGVSVGLSVGTSLVESVISYPILCVLFPPLFFVVPTFQVVKKD